VRNESLRACVARRICSATSPFSAASSRNSSVSSDSRCRAVARGPSSWAVMRAAVRMPGFGNPCRQVVASKPGEQLLGLAQRGRVAYAQRRVVEHEVLARGPLHRHAALSQRLGRRGGRHRALGALAALGDEPLESDEAVHGRCGEQGADEQEGDDEELAEGERCRPDIGADSAWAPQRRLDAAEQPVTDSQTARRRT
jgi:hypothetical protein